MMRPREIEDASFEIIQSLLGTHSLDPAVAHVVKRCIHTSADFDYAENLYFSPTFYESITDAFKKGCTVVTDTTMALAGINKTVCARYGIDVVCFIGDESVKRESEDRGVTRSALSVRKAASIQGNLVYVVGNAPTALMEICNLYERGVLSLRAVVGVPVGFVNVVESKERLMDTDLPCVVARGRKGGSNIAAAICNAILYDLIARETMA